MGGFSHHGCHTGEITDPKIYVCHVGGFSHHGHHTKGRSLIIKDRFAVWEILVLMDVTWQDYHCPAVSKIPARPTW